MPETHNPLMEFKSSALPVGWERKKLRDLTTLMTNGFVGVSIKHYVASGVPYLMANNVRRNEVDSSTITYITEEFHKKNARSRLRVNDILTVQTGHIGVSCLVPPKFDGANTHALII